METKQTSDASDEILVERNDRGERSASRRVAQPKAVFSCGVGDDNMASVDTDLIGEQCAERARIDGNGGVESIRSCVENDRDGSQFRLPDDRL